MRSRTAFAALPVVILFSGLSLAEDSPEVAALRAKLVEVKVRVEQAMPKAKKEAAAAAVQLEAVSLKLEGCESNAERVRQTCDDNCEETKWRCIKANDRRSYARSACEDRETACRDRCSDTEKKTCAALMSKKEQLWQVSRRPAALLSEIEDAERAIPEQRRIEQARREAEEERRKAEENGRKAAAEAEEQRHRYILEDEGDAEGTGTGVVLDTKTNLRWLRFTGPEMDQGKASAYCVAKGMRLPTKDEALAIAGFKSYSHPAWTKRGEYIKGWSTWTSSSDAAGRGWVVRASGDTTNRKVDFPEPVLCVR